MGEVHRRHLSDLKGSTSRASKWFSGQTPKLILIGCVLISDIQWFFEDSFTSWVVWSAANWVRCAVLCLFAGYLTANYTTRAWCILTAIFFASKVPLEFLPEDVHISPAVMYMAFVLYVALGSYIIRKNDPKGSARPSPQLGN